MRTLTICASLLVLMLAESGCEPDVTFAGAKPVVLVNRYETDEETHLSVLNVTCSLYPSDAASEQRQVAGAKGALEALVREVRPPK